MGAAFDELGLEIRAAGSVSVIYGSASGLTASGNQFFSQETPGIEEEAETGDFFSSALTAGDFDGDGFGDLGVGVPEEDMRRRANAGVVHVIRGSATGLTSENA